MKRLIRNSVIASSNITADTIMFTPTEVVELLSQIEELKEYVITVNQLADRLRFTVGNVYYDVT